MAAVLQAEREPRWILAGQGSGLVGARVREGDGTVTVLVRGAASASLASLSFPEAREWARRLAAEIDGAEREVVGPEEGTE